MQPQSIALLQKIDSNVDQILQKFQEIFEVSIIQDKSKELLSIESLSIESDALIIVRLCEDLLSLSRSLKETWCLGTLKVNSHTNETQYPEEVDQIFEKFNKLTDKITRIEEKDIKEIF